MESIDRYPHLQHGDTAKVLTVCGKTMGVTSAQFAENTSRQRSAATRTWCGLAEERRRGLARTSPLGSIVARVTTCIHPSYL